MGTVREVSKATLTTDGESLHDDAPVAEDLPRFRRLDKVTAELWFLGKKSRH